MDVKAAGALSEEISRTQESIHQEVRLQASAARVYFALTDAEQFQKLTLLSVAVNSGMVKSTTPAQISSEVGGAFVLFGGIIHGRQIELKANERIVQAWRVADWPAGVARFRQVVPVAVIQPAAPAEPAPAEVAEDAPKTAA